MARGLNMPKGSDKRGEIDDDEERPGASADDDKKGSAEKSPDAKRPRRADSGKPLTDEELKAAANKRGPEGKRALTALLLKGNLNA